MAKVKARSASPKKGRDEDGDDDVGDGAEPHEGTVTARLFLPRPMLGAALTALGGYVRGAPPVEITLPGGGLVTAPLPLGRFVAIGPRLSRAGGRAVSLVLPVVGPTPQLPAARQTAEGLVCGPFYLDVAVGERWAELALSAGDGALGALFTQAAGVRQLLLTLGQGGLVAVETDHLQRLDDGATLPDPADHWDETGRPFFDLDRFVDVATGA